jgi:hypothetical protein
MGDLANTPTLTDATTYTAADFNAIFQALTVATGVVDTNKLAAEAVTLAKITQLAASTLLGNKTAGLATPTALTVAEVRTLLGIGTRGLQNDGSSGSFDIVMMNRLSLALETGYTTAGAVALAIDNRTNGYLGLTGNATISVTGIAAGYWLELIVHNTTGGSVTITWPAWKASVAAPLPASLGAGESFLLRLQSKGTTIGEVFASA